MDQDGHNQLERKDKISYSYMLFSTNDNQMFMINKTLILMIAPGYKSYQCFAGMWKRQLSCHAGRQEVGRCCTRGESQGMCNITCMPLLSSNKAEPTLALKPRGDVTRSPK